MDNLAKIETAYVNGTSAIPVSIEACIRRGIPGTHLVGTCGCSAAVEALQRVRCAILSAGFTFPQADVTVSFSPAQRAIAYDSQFDLAVAIAILVASRQIDGRALSDTIAIGELALDGRVLRGGRGGAVYAMAAVEEGRRLLCAESYELPSVIAADARSVANLSDLRSSALPLARTFEIERAELRDDAPRVAEAAGAEGGVIRAALAGKRNLLVVSGRSIAEMAAQVAKELDPLSDEESMEVVAIAAAAGLPCPPDGRPFRAPHVSITLSGLIGGGKPIYPGEVTLAHRGILLLEDLNEYGKAHLLALSDVVAERKVTISRAAGWCSMPADFLLIGTARPCPCGHFGDRGHDCTCSAGHVREYQDRLAQIARMLDCSIANL